VENRQKHGKQVCYRVKQSECIIEKVFVVVTWFYHLILLWRLGFNSGTTCDGKETAQPVFDHLKCFLNWDQDRVDFEYSIIQRRWKELSSARKYVTYEKINSSTFEKTVLELPVKSDEPETESNYTVVSLAASFKDRLLNLFSQHNKEFKLTIEYEMDGKKYKTVFYTTIPQIDQK
jgi:hypothetical protein